MLIDKLHAKLSELDAKPLRVDYTSKYVLCELVDNSCTPFATWSFNDEGHLFLGHYFDNYEDALFDFYKRTHDFL